MVSTKNARRYFFELHVNHTSQIAAQALQYIAQLWADIPRAMA